ncbi:hypothetical protein [Dyella tabacisoli]|uniref:Uncharacterized protein n=1 Tax=Dyella tabacisoli TaxID=2282381 RepID=A0A369UPP8_9GAMM|nr:hypothetical protein [Dyella tabacisoli]RDD82447.1 hypothetical protein DVJ77_05730 [Dyella tabacisoli]
MSINIRSSLSICSLALVASLGATAVYAQTATADAQVQASATSNDQKPLSDRNCLRETGSHIPPQKGKCMPGTGRVYTQDDIQRTGERDLGPALQKLDPSVTTHGH